MEIAEDLIRIALLAAWRLPDGGRLGFHPLKRGGAPGRWRAAKLELEGARKCFARLEAGGQRGFKHGFLAAAGQPERRLLEPSALRIAAQHRSEEHTSELQSPCN